jgi:subtilisin family serine protease
MSKKNRGRKLFNLILIATLILSFNVTAFAQQGIHVDPNGVVQVESTYYADAAKEETAAPVPKSDLVSVIVKLDFEPLATYSGGVNGLVATNPEIAGTNKLDSDSAASQAYLAYAEAHIASFQSALAQAIPSAKLVNRYRSVLGGASVILPASELSALSSLKGVKAVYRDEIRHIDTDASPQFIGAPTIWSQLGGQESSGEGVIVGVIDTGVWPEHPSFSDPDPSGKAYAPPPGGPYDCDFGNTAANPDDDPFTCNNKLIGAYTFIDTYVMLNGLPAGEFDSARDAEGHGTHTAGTAAGNAGVDATLLGVDRGLISGVAPRAYVIMYKALVLGSGYTSDLAAAVDQAVLNGVDVTNYSISGGNDPYNDAAELAFLDAYAAGVFPAHSAGNDGPGANTVAHRGPWVTTVGASNSDRFFISTVSLTGIISGTTNVTETLTLSGASVTDGISTPTEVVSAADYGDAMCNSPFTSGTFTGQIVICERGVIARVEKSFNVAEGGAGGMLLYNPSLQGLATDNHFIPSVHLENDEGVKLLDFMDNHTDVMGTFTEGEATTVQGDVMAAFSSRGGSGTTLGVSKPDITAPGVQILAGMTPIPATVEGGLPGELFQAIQGTSMSSPHIAGAGALLKALHPDWTPGQIKSAIMTTAKTSDVTKEDGTTPADAFDYGSGRVDLTVAGDPGITFDVSFRDYITQKGDLWNVNYPSVYIPALPGEVTVYRTAHSTLGAASVWDLSVDAPSDLEITVPATLNLAAGGNSTFAITIDARNVPIGETRMATLMLSDGTHEAHVPITIVRKQASVTLEKSCDMSVLGVGDISDCTITATNTAFDEAFIGLTDVVPNQLVISGTVSGATSTGNSIVLNDTLGGAAPPVVTAAVDPLASPAGYLPLSSFGITPFTQTDEQISNYIVPSFVYAGDTYNRIGIVSNGYVVVGGGTNADVDYINSNLPDAALPNNVLAPFWTDLNPADGGALRIATLTDSGSGDSWIVIEWTDVPIWSNDTITNTFQVWIGYTQPDDISFTYGPNISGGEGGYLTVGAENKYGNTGQAVYFDGTGAAPAPSSTGYEVDVSSMPGAPGDSAVIHYSMIGAQPGRWQNCAEMSSDAFAGTSVSCVNGQYGDLYFLPVIFNP